MRSKLGLPLVAQMGVVHRKNHPHENHRLMRAMDEGLEAAMRPDARPLAGISEIQGMSGQRYRMFVNRVLACVPGARYLEIGSWKGSTACAALHGNNVFGLCIDNWSLFGGPKEEFVLNMHRFATPPASWQHREQDFRQIDFNALGVFDVYLFDGPHTRLDQYEGVTRAQPALAQTHLLIVDDWNWSDVRLGTMHALWDLGCQIRACMEVRTTLDEAHGKPAGQDSDWHNGYFMAVVRK